ncbi:alpha/beta hydrolase [Rhodopseudomonas sp. P2A-2r]|uniref:alpha/beta hydrolase n=1 Tax=unclassified Rhodopseudomonas TaxID=2638247 RepID=UPI002233FEB4|nr:alpha/beta hydrolase [Rhodopseudomonas sp. P2A-2r]UZE50551.1 alpha/beta hydrolase [Rhodopseudomonas sp. P2A-2r]
MTDLSHIHRFAPGNRREAAPLLLLHGTGGDENDLLPLGQAIAPGAALLSVRGKVLENGMPRFFRRLAEGVFDEDDVRKRANELADFVAAARERYDLAAPIALGYSNGANIAAAMMLLRPETLAGGILLRAMVPLRDVPKAELSGKPVLIVSGTSDPIIPPSNAAALADMLSNAGADVQQKVLPVGHQLSQADLTVAKAWLQGVEQSTTVSAN